ncbi:39S ribosomal protein L16, mitochondrial, partial [Corapipo altera]|uniref:39S ribosomal protein L16, mitochondrial n=1 Tax=Corapipo altera TaxID=415028 RepID=UPI000FD654D7
VDTVKGAGPRRDPPLYPAGPGAVAMPRAGLKKWVLPPDYSGITIPEKPKLKFMDKVPAVPKVRREPRMLRDIRGPSREATDFIQGQYGILVSAEGRRGGGEFQRVALEN